MPKATKAKNVHLGQSFEDFLNEQGLLEEVDARAIKKVLAWQLTESMKAGSLTKIEMAQRMGTSRAQLDRVLNPDNQSVTLDTLLRAAQAVGRKLRLELV